MVRIPTRSCKKKDASIISQTVKIMESAGLPITSSPKILCCEPIKQGSILFWGGGYPGIPPPKILENSIQYYLKYSVITNCKASLPTLILVKMGLKCSLRGLKFQKFCWGHAPDPPRNGNVLLKIDLYSPPHEKSCTKPRKI